MTHRIYLRFFINLWLIVEIEALKLDLNWCCWITFLAQLSFILCTLFHDEYDSTQIPCVLQKCSVIRRNFVSSPHDAKCMLRALWTREKMMSERQRQSVSESENVLLVKFFERLRHCLINNVWGMAEGLERAWREREKNGRDGSWTDFYVINRRLLINLVMLNIVQTLGADNGGHGKLQKSVQNGTWNICCCWHLWPMNW